VVGTTLGVAFAGELFGWAQALGMVLVLGGVLAGQPAVHAWFRRPRVGVRTGIDENRAGADDRDPQLSAA
jgi:probable blue pigment (indigoidine) exporter